MKSFAFCTAVFLPICVFSQQQWHHQLLQRGFNKVSQDNDTAHVNGAGQAFYFVGFHGSVNQDVYRNTENMSAWLGPERVAYSIGINEKGQVAYGGSTGPGFTIYTDHTDWSSSVLNPNTTYNFNGYGIDEFGRPLWKATETGARAGIGHLFLASQPVSDSLLTDPVRVSSQYVNAKGDVAWDATANETNGVQQVFLNQTFYSASIVGANVPAGVGGISDNGDVFWTANYNGFRHLFVNDLDYTNFMFGAGATDHRVFGRGMDEQGDILWYTGGVTNGPEYGLFVNNRNLSYEVFGTQTLQQREALQISGNGHAYWDAKLPDWSHVHLFVDTRDVSLEALGPDVIPDAYRAEADDFGRLMWTVRDPFLGSKNRVYVDSFALSADALGLDAANYDSRGIRMGPNGDVVWIASDPTGKDSRLYLSSPVPEPSMAALLAAFCYPIMRRGCRAASNAGPKNYRSRRSNRSRSE